MGASLGCAPHPAASPPAVSKDLGHEVIAERYRTPLDSSPPAAAAPDAGDTAALDREPVAARYRIPFDRSPKLAVAPGGRMAMAWVHSDRIGAWPYIQYTLSSDGGATWTVPALRDDERGFDPALAVDHHGTFYLASIGPRGVVVAKSPVGSSRFGPPVRIGKSEGADGPSIAVTPAGTVLLTWAILGSAEAACARTVDGEHWTLAPVTPDHSPPDRIRLHFQLCTPVHGGRIWVVYADMTYRRGADDATVAGYGLQYTEDDGVTWSSRETAVSLAVENAAAGSVVPSCVGEERSVWVLYGLSADPPPPKMTPRSTALRLARSTDGGLTFEAHDNVSSRAAGDLYLTPTLVRGPEGSLHVVYYGNGAAGAGEDRGVLVWSTSHDLGATFSPPVPLRSGLRFVHLGADGGDAWLGYWIGVVAAEGGLHVSYVDNVGHPSRIAYLRRPLP